MNIKEYVLMVAKRLPAVVRNALKKMVYLAGIGVFILVILALGIQEISHRAERRRQRRSATFMHLLDGASYVKNKQLDKAIEEFRGAIKISPESENADAYYGLAYTYKELEQYQKAAQNFKKVISLDPDDATTYVELGIILSQNLRKYQEAAENFERATKLKPEYVNAWINLGVVRKKMGLIKEAVKCFKKAIILEPDNLLAHYNLGGTYLAMSDKQAVLREYDILKVLDAELAQNFKNHIETGVDDPEGAEKILEKKRRKIKDAKKYAELGRSYTKAKNYIKAIENYEIAAKLYPTSAVIWSNLGVCYRSLEQCYKAIACFKKAIILQPDYALAFYNLSYTYFALGQKPAAVRGYNVVKKLDPKLAQDLLNYM